MSINTYIVTLRHDKGTVKIKLVSFGGRQDVIKQITAAEGCPERAIVTFKKMSSKKV